jgi:hypothetical protein
MRRSARSGKRYSSRGSGLNRTRLSVTPIKERSWDGNMECQNEKCAYKFITPFVQGSGGLQGVIRGVRPSGGSDQVASYLRTSATGLQEARGSPQADLNN